MIDFNKKMYVKDRLEFVEFLKEQQTTIGFPVSARGWCYLMEQKKYVDKSQFNKIEEAINKCRKEGLLPVDFVAEEDARSFAGLATLLSKSCLSSLTATDASILSLSHSERQPGVLVVPILTCNRYPEGAN